MSCMLVSCGRHSMTFLNALEGRKRQVGIFARRLDNYIAVSRSSSMK